MLDRRLQHLRISTSGAMSEAYVVYRKYCKVLCGCFLSMLCSVSTCFRERLFFQIIRFMAVFTLVVLATLRSATPGLAAESKFMRVHGSTEPPHGFIEFCRKHEAECRVRGLQTSRFEASPQLLSELDEVNRLINTAIEPATDAEIYGVQEYWTFPKSAGDCEDYVVLKRRVLMQRGWPASALLITVVLDERGDGHAVLTARTSHGDFILDNQTADVKLWINTPYRYVMRQSYINPRVWMSLYPQAVWPWDKVSSLHSKS